MRFLAAVLVVAAVACSRPKKEQVMVAASERSSTFDVAFVDTFDGAPATHVAVGGKLRVRVPDGQVTATTVGGPFAIAQTDNTFVITATGEGTGEIEIETVTGYTRVVVTAAPIEDVTLQFDPADERNATIVLRDANGKRLVDASLRIAPGSAAVSLLRNTWDHIVFQTLPPGAVLVKTDLLGATRAKVQKVASRDRFANR
jgi:hypothetical protein